MKVDFQNAFNTRKRDIVASCLFAAEEAAPVWRFFQFAYARPSVLGIYGQGGKLIDSISAEEGLKQGCPLASFAYALSVQPIYQRVDAEVNGPSGRAVGVSDDLTLVGPVVT